MKFNDEIKEIREMYDIMRNTSNNNFAKRLGDEEFSDGVTYMSTKDTNLPYDIIIDCGETYKYFKHPLCLYVVNGDGMDNSSEVIPVIISDNPSVINSNKTINIAPIIDFTRNNNELLNKLANLEISGPNFFEHFIPYASKKEERFVSESVAESNYGPNDTGLDIWIYVDDTQSFLRSGHNQSYRMKFQQDKEVKNQRLWMPIRLPDLQIMTSDKIPPCKEPQWKIDKVLKWAELNMDGLLKLKDAAITGKEFYNLMQKIDGVKIEFDHQLTNSKSYAKKDKLRFGYYLVKADDNTFNFVNEDGILCSPEQWFDEASCFMKSEKGIHATVKIGNKWYLLMQDGQLIEF